jgi:hypothetical protein
MKNVKPNESNMLIRIYRLEVYIMTGNLEGLKFFEFLTPEDNPCGCYMFHIWTLGFTWLSDECS